MYNLVRYFLQKAKSEENKRDNRTNILFRKQKIVRIDDAEIKSA